MAVLQSLISPWKRKGKKKEKGNFQEALEDLHRIEEITEMNPSALHGTGRDVHDLLRETAQVYKKLGDAERAKEEFQNALSFYTQGIDVKCKDDRLNVELYLARSRLQRFLENFQEAFEDLHRVEEITEMNPSALHGTGIDHDSLRGFLTVLLQKYARVVEFKPPAE